MLVRIVKLQFQQENIPDFLALFEESKHLIAAFEGCLHLELWQDTKDPCTFFTHSRWQSETALDAYRHSPFFQNTWRKTKAFFKEPAHAWSVSVQSVL